MQETIQRYQRRIKEVQIDKSLVEQNMQVINPIFNQNSCFQRSILVKSLLLSIRFSFSDLFVTNSDLEWQHLKHEAADMSKKIEHLEVAKRFELVGN